MQISKTPKKQVHLNEVRQSQHGGVESPEATAARLRVAL
jgi:hypothetical protein